MIGRVEGRFLIVALLYAIDDDGLYFVMYVCVTKKRERRKNNGMMGTSIFAFFNNLSRTVRIIPLASYCTVLQDTTYVFSCFLLYDKIRQKEDDKIRQMITSK
jgi:hypothetical protein